ncbi:hypothetical protein ABW20_dc0101024 [Dactylellina cionopaga]|nr:hypothetical protein ABW20_dc0101024 [Dactylellina cionopaga]
MAPIGHLGGLPDDIKYLILTSLPDVRSLNSLCKASPDYASLRDSFRSSIERKVYLADALKYSRESVWVACHRDVLYRWYTLENELQQAVDQYLGYMVPTVAENGEVGRGGCYEVDIEVVQDKIISNHRYILSLYEEMVKRDLERREAVSTFLSLEGRTVEEARREDTYFMKATATEEKRIVAGLYRSWVIVLMTCQHKVTVDRRWYLGLVFSSWSFWEFMCIRAVQRMLWSEIYRVVEDTIFDDAERLAIEEEGEVLDYANTYTDVTGGLILLHDFPAQIHNWFEGNKATSGNPEQQKEAISHIRELLDVKKKCMSLDIPFPNTNVFDHYQEFLTRERTTPDDYIRCCGFRKRRLCRVGRTADAKKIEGKTYWIKGRDLLWPEESALDLNACVWDNWRLKTWGHTLPY